MKKLTYIIVLVVALAAGQALAVQVTQVALNYENGATVARVTADGPFQFSHQTEVPKEGKGDRMILDLIGVTTGLSVKNFADLPKCGITSIRTGQFAVTPEKVVRVVFDLTKAPVYQVERQGNSVKITFTDKAVSAFPSWTSGAVTKASPQTPAPKPAPAVAQTAPVSKVPSPVASVDKVQATEKDRLASLSGSTKPSAQPPTSPAPLTPAANPVKVVTVDGKPVTPTVSTPIQTPVKVIAVDNSKSPLPFPNAPANSAAPAKVVAEETPKPVTPTVPVASTPAAPTRTPDVAEPVTPSPAVAVKPAPSESKPATAVTVQPKPASPVADANAKPNAPVAPQTAPVKPAPPATTGNQIQQAVSAKPSSSPVADKPTSVAKSEDKETVKPATVAQNNSLQPHPVPTATISPDSKPIAGAAKTEAPAPVLATPAPTKPSGNEARPAPAVTIPRALADDESVQMAEVDKVESANPDLPANRSTSRFRRNAAADAKIKGTMVAEFPQRLVVKYESLGNRDPFATLIDDSRTYNTPVENRVPNIDGLRLVGIIESDRGATDNRALFEDKNGYSYILSSGDKVQRGYVLRVEKDRVYFQIFEYGWSRTVALAIENAN